MFKLLVRTSLGHPRLATALALALLVYGALIARAAPLETLPTLAPAHATVETEAPGLVSEQVEEIVTRPVENALIGARGVGTVHSTSIQGLSTLTLDFAAGVDPEQVRQEISERLQQTAGTLPAGVGTPHLTPLVAGDGPFLTLGLSSAALTPMALRDLAQWTIRPRLLSTAGVGNVEVFGGETRRIEVRARAGDLSDSDLGYGDVFDAVRRATGVAGSGFIDTPTQRIQVEPHGQALTAIDVAAGQIQVVGSAPVRISDVADVVDTPAPAFGDALIMGKPGVVLRLFTRFGADRLAATRAADEALSALTPALRRQGVTVWSGLDRPGEVLTRSLGELVGEIAVGAAFLVLLLILFLRDWRAALIAAVSIPLSLVCAVGVLRLLGWSLNTMTLGGLAVALGLIVDDAVIDLDAVLSSLRSAEQKHASRAEAILKASLRVRGPVVYVTLMLAAALMPIVLLPGVQGALLRPLAVSVIAASCASLLVALLVTPALTLLFLEHIRPSIEPGGLARVRRAYDRALESVERHGRTAAGVALVVLALAAALAATLRPELLPRLYGGRFTAEINAPPTTSLAAMRDFGGRISGDLVADPAVRGVTMEIGRAAGGEEAFGPEHGAFDISLSPTLTLSGEAAAERRIRTVLARYPGLEPRVRSSLGGRDLARAAGEAIEARVYGEDLDAIETTAGRVRDALQGSPDVGAVATSVPATAAVVRVDLDFQRLAIYGLSALDVLDTVQTAFEGRPAAEIYDKGRAVEIAVTAQPDYRLEPERAGDLLLRSSSGISVPLRSVANVYATDGRVRIDHEGGLRSARVSARPVRPDEALAGRIEAKILKTVVPAPGSYVEFVSPETQFDPNHSLLVNAALAAVAILALLAVGFESLRAAVVILISTVFALAGGVAAAAISGGTLSLGALIGFFALFGLSARSAALLIERVEELAFAPGLPWSMEVVRRAAHDRFTPRVMSAAVVAAGLLPLALRADLPGHEILGPLAIVILGGLLSSSVLGLLLLPELVFRLGRPVSAAPA